MVRPAAGGAAPGGLERCRLRRRRPESLLHRSRTTLSHRADGSGERHPPRHRVEHQPLLRRAGKARARDAGAHRGGGAAGRELAERDGLPRCRDVQPLLREAHRPLRHSSRRRRSTRRPRCDRARTRRRASHLRRERFRPHSRARVCRKPREPARGLPDGCDLHRIVADALEVDREAPHRRARPRRRPQHVRGAAGDGARRGDVA